MELNRLAIVQDLQARLLGEPSELERLDAKIDALSDVWSGERGSRDDEEPED